MNWDLLGKAIGWLPGAGAGGLVGGVAAALSFDSVATSCAIGGPFVGVGGTVSQLREACVLTPVGDLGMVEFTAMVGVIGAVVGIVVQQLIDRAS